MIDKIEECVSFEGQLASVVDTTGNALHVVLHEGTNMAYVADSAKGVAQVNINDYWTSTLK